MKKNLMITFLSIFFFKLKKVIYFYCLKFVLILYIPILITEKLLKNLLFINIYVYMQYVDN